MPGGTRTHEALGVFAALFAALFAAGSILDEKMVHPKKFVGVRRLVLFKFAITDWGLLVIGLVIAVFAPSSCAPSL